MELLRPIAGNGTEAATAIPIGTWPAADVPHFDPVLILEVLLVAAAAAGIAWSFSRALKPRLGVAGLGAAVATSLLLAGPYLATVRLFAPTITLAGQLPVPDRMREIDRHDGERNDAIFQFLPWELEVRRALARGRLPFWSDSLDGGSDLWANPQAQALSPIAWLARPLPIQHFLLGSYVGKLVLALLGAFVLARRLGVHRASARLAALAFALGGSVSPWAVFPHSSAVAWAPWVAAGVLTLARRPTRPAFVATGLATAALLLGGHPEVAAAAIVFSALLGLALGRRRQALVRSLLSPALAGLVGVGIAAVQWVPLLIVAQHSQRAAEQRARPPLERLSLGVEHPAHLLGLLHPAPSGTGAAGLNPLAGPRQGWSYNATVYLGLTGLVGLFALGSGRIPRRAWPLLGFGAFTLVGLADFVPLERLLRATPGLRLVEDSRFVPAGMLALCLASGLGLQRLVSAPRFRRSAVVAAACAASLAVGPASAVIPIWSGLAAALAMPAKLLGRGVAVVALLDLATFAWGNLPRGHPEDFYPRSAIMELMQAEQRAPNGPWRGVGHDYLAYPSVLAVYGIEDIRPHNPLSPQSQIDALAAVFGFRPGVGSYFGGLRGLEHPFACFLGVRSVLSNAYLPPVDGTARVDHGESSPFHLLRTGCTVPRWFAPTAVEPVEPPGLSAWLSTLQDPRRIAVTQEVGRMGPFAARTGDPAVVDAHPGRAVLTFEPLPATSVLASSIPAAPGWRAFDEDEPLPLATIHGAFLGVVVPPGVARVEVRFEPPGIRLGLALAALAILALISLTLTRAGGRLVLAR